MTDHYETDGKPGLGAQIWGAMRGALIDEDPIAAARRAKLQAAKAAPEAADAAPAAVPVPAAPMSPMAATLLAQVLAKATAYTALTEKLAPLESIVVDERTRYQAAYALIKGSRTVDQVVQAIDMQHLPALEAEAGRFAAQLEDKERREVGARSQELQALTTDIDAAARQVAKLREDADERIRQIEATVARDRERQAQLAREIDDRRQELADVKRQFDAATKSVEHALGAAKATVRRYLG
jgi:DNA repair exonuclease SbcCD ATPase subunit